MNAKTKLPKISKQAAAEIADAARKGYSNSDADKFFEEVMEAARHYGNVFAESDEKTRTE